MPEFDYRKKPGDRAIQYGAWNRLVQKQTAPKATPPTNINHPRDYDQVKVENATGYNTDPFSILKAEGKATWEERPNDLFVGEGMRNGVEIAGENITDEWNMATVLQKSAPEGCFAQGVTSGPTACFIHFLDEASLKYPYAVPIPGNLSMFQASPYGLNRILWHAEPTEEIIPCTGVVLQAYINMGEDEQWVFFKLQEDLTCCGSASALLVDECGNQIGECPIIKTVYAPPSVTICGCETTCESWKAGEVVPFWWYQYLEKWVTIPKHFPDIQTAEQSVITEIEASGLSFIPKTEEVQIITNIQLDAEAFTLASSSSVEVEIETETVTEEIPVTGSVSMSGEVTVTDDITLSGELNGTATIPAGSFAGEADVEVSGTVTVSGSGTLSGGTPTNFIQAVAFTEPTLETKETTIPIYRNGTCSGTLNTPTTPTNIDVQSGNLTLSGGISTEKKSVLSSVSFNPNALSVNISEGSVTLDLSAISFEIEIPTGATINQDTCEITFTTTPQTVTLSGSVSVPISSLTASITATGAVLNTTTTQAVTSATLSGASISGQIAVPIPSTFSGTVTSAQTGSVTVREVTKWEPSALAITPGVLTIPTTATVTSTGEATLSGVADLSTLNTSDISVTLDAPLTVSGPVSLTGSVSLSTTNPPLYVSVPVTNVTGSATIPIYDTILVNENALTIETDWIPKVEVETTTGTISTSSKTIKYLTCKPC